MAQADRRRGFAHGVEVAATTGALGTAAALGAERVRDRYRTDKPKTLRRVAARAGPLEGTIRRGRVPPALVGAGTLAAGVAYGAQKYQEQLSHREVRNARRQAREAKHKLGRDKIAARAPQEVVDMETGILSKAVPYRVERHRSQAEAGTAGAGLIAAEAARRSHFAQRRELRAAESARTARRVSGATSVFSGLAAAGGSKGMHEAYKEGRKAFHEEHAFNPGAHPFTPPRRPPVRRAAGESDVVYQARRAKRDTEHEKRVGQLRTEHEARAKAMHQRLMEPRARKAGLLAAARKGGPVAAGTVGSLATGATATVKHGELRRATKLAARHGAAAKTRGAAALGLLATAAALHESKNRKPAQRISYTGYGPRGSHL